MIVVFTFREILSDFPARALFLCVCFAHERSEAAIDVRRCRQSKMNAVTEAPERFNPQDLWVNDSPAQPETRVEPVVVSDRASICWNKWSGDSALARST